MPQCVSSFHRTAGAAPLLAWNRMLQSQNQFQPSQYQGLGGPMSYPQRPEDRMDRGRQVRERCPILHRLFSSWIKLLSCVAVESECSTGSHSWASFSPVAVSPVKALTGKLPSLVRPLRVYPWRKAHAMTMPLLLFIKSRSNMLPSHTLLAAWENIIWRQVFQADSSSSVRKSISCTFWG